MLTTIWAKDLRLNLARLLPAAEIEEVRKCLSSNHLMETAKAGTDSS
jgi:hypothetical protein